MLTLIASLLLQPTDQRAACSVEAGVGVGRRNSEIYSLTAECPAGSGPELQAAAQAALDQVDISEPFSSGAGVANEIYLEQLPDGDWQPIPGQFVIYTHLQMPVRIVERGYRHLACSFATRPDSGGRLADLRTTCRIDGDDRQTRLIRTAERDLAEALENSRLLPVPVNYCFSDELEISAAVINVSGRTPFEEEASPAPHVDLPNLCEEEIR